MELQNSLMLVKADLRRKVETLAQTQAACSQLPPSGSDTFSTPSSCKKRGCGAAAPSDAENRPPSKRPFFPSLFPTRTPTRKYNSRAVEETNDTPYARILRSRQQSPPRSPVLTSRSLRGKYWALWSHSGSVFFWFYANKAISAGNFIYFYIVLYISTFCSVVNSLPNTVMSAWIKQLCFK